MSTFSKDPLSGAHVPGWVVHFIAYIKPAFYLFSSMIGKVQTLRAHTPQRLRQGEKEMEVKLMEQDTAQ